MGYIEDIGQSDRVRCIPVAAKLIQDSSENYPCFRRAMESFPCL
jgi:hypothetical protein